MYATTRYNFVRLKATHKISPLEELVEGRSPPSSSQRLTGMAKRPGTLIVALLNVVFQRFILNGKTQSVKVE